MVFIIDLRMQSPCRQRSLMAQLSSDVQVGMQIPSAHCIGLRQSEELKHVEGIRTHSTVGFPVKSSGHEHCFR